MTLVLPRGLPQRPRHRQCTSQHRCHLRHPTCLLGTTQVQLELHYFVHSRANALSTYIPLTSNTRRLWSTYGLRPSGTMGPPCVELCAKPRSATTVCTTVGHATTVCNSRAACDTIGCPHKCQYVYLLYLYSHIGKHVCKLIIYINLGLYHTPGAGPSSSAVPGT